MYAPQNRDANCGLVRFRRAIRPPITVSMTSLRGRVKPLTGIRHSRTLAPPGRPPAPPCCANGACGSRGGEVKSPGRSGTGRPRPLCVPPCADVNGRFKIDRGWTADSAGPSHPASHFILSR